MFHVCAIRFDVMGNLEKFLVFGGPCLVRKNFQDSTSHRIFSHIQRALNINKK